MGLKMNIGKLVYVDFSEVLIVFFYRIILRCFFNIDLF